MWKKIAPLLIVLSAALNIAFISAWVVYAAKPGWTLDEPPNEESGCPLHRYYLKVTDEQWQQIEPRIAEFRRSTRTLCADIYCLRRKLIDLIAADEPDRQAIAAKQEEIRTGQQQMQQMVIEHLLAEKKVLTAEQEKDLFDMFRQQCACGGLGRMMGLPEGDSGVPATQPDPSHNSSSSMKCKGE